MIYKYNIGVIYFRTLCKCAKTLLCGELNFPVLQCINRHTWVQRVSAATSLDDV